MRAESIDISDTDRCALSLASRIDAGRRMGLDLWYTKTGKTRKQFRLDQSHGVLMFYDIADLLGITMTEMQIVFVGQRTIETNILEMSTVLRGDTIDGAVNIHDIPEDSPDNCLFPDTDDHYPHRCESKDKILRNIDRLLDNRQVLCYDDPDC
jgi:hypothetical protein